MEKEFIEITNLRKNENYDYYKNHFNKFLKFKILYKNNYQNNINYIFQFYIHYIENNNQ